MKKLLLTAFIASTLIAPLNASDETKDNKYLYFMHKVDGACESLGNIIDNQLEGENDYIDKLFEYQYESLGFNSELEMLMSCQKTVEIVLNPQAINYENITSEKLDVALNYSRIAGYCSTFDAAEEVVSTDSDRPIYAKVLFSALENLELDLESFLLLCHESKSNYLQLIGQEIASTILTPLNASEEFEDNRYLYAMHKFKGACDFLSTMANLQKGLKMEGGDEFIKKLFRYEATRIDYTLEEYGSTCAKSREVAADPQVLNIENIPASELDGLLAVSEMTGYCGLYKSAADVVSSEEEQSFLVRFLSTELAKSGTELDTFMRMCELSNSEYLKITGQE